MRLLVSVAAFLLVLTAGPTIAAAAGAQAPGPQVAELDEIVVLARRSGAPMWTVTRGDSTLILVGAITGIPRDLAWRPDDLEVAAARSGWGRDGWGVWGVGFSVGSAMGCIPSSVWYWSCGEGASRLRMVLA